MKIDLFLILYSAFGAIGMIEWAKGFFPAANKNIWRAGLPTACLVMAAAFTLLPPFVSMTLLALALAQLCYQTIIETVRKLITRT
jgi:hypothetical protein